MSQVPVPEVFTAREVARAAGVPLAEVHALFTSGQLRPIAGTPFISAADALRAGRLLLHAARAATPAPASVFDGPVPEDARPVRMPAIASSLVHATLLTLAVVMTSLDVNSASTDEAVHDPVRLVFLVTPGPGGGGGGGGLRNPAPPPKVERKGPPRPQISVPMVTPKPAMTTARRDVAPPKEPTPAAPPIEPKPATREPDLLPSNVLVAPVVTAAADDRDRDGLIDGGRGDADSHGSGAGGGVGSGQGTGNGEGSGSGIGPGSGGGTGGGPYRPGSGIEPPRLLREIKAEYTDEARRRNISGEVVLEIVIRTDGTVGDVRVLRGLGAGLDQKAVQAVRQWRFDPARRKGIPVDVLVEVAVEFILR